MAKVLSKLTRIVVFCTVLLFLASGCATNKPVGSASQLAVDDVPYYRPQSFGSDSLYNPASAFFSYTLDTLQLPDNFDTADFSDDLSLVWDRLKHPRRAIDNEGGSRRFINREIFPIDSDHRRDSYAALPNYTLHLLGGGIAFRRDREWFAARGYKYPGLAAVSVAMVSEILQEALEVQNTTDADPVADVYLFRPIGMLLFSHDRIAKYIQRKLDPAIWPTISSIDPFKRQFINTGISYIYRPPALGIGKARLFLHSGLNNMIGLSHSLASGNHLSWAVGAAIQEIVRQRNIQADLRPSFGLFLDREKSLLGCLMINDVGKTRLRINLYPASIPALNRAGVFLSMDDDRKFSAGIVYRLPLGVGVGAR